MVKIRLMRMGSMKNPHYRLVVVDGRTKRSGDYIEQIGYYDPRETTSESLRVDAERAKHWMAQGAQPTDTALRLLQKSGVELPNALEAKRRSSYVKREEANQARA
ncbi:MAG: 30S ribosomal protein S16 [Trueperaceae bacterium]|nr:30S ribosomal protein S16 [Trueperaceae bacterium]MCC6310188.1 30S ribosomal protein S16 [Trueperaceae bacterium]MCO5175090.1 30S ribosomal protein S16 [Trueperaceae bacterium]MCW5819306.1 30S ribosomal protein S16 [Trueperaceae bacterium]